MLAGVRERDPDDCARWAHMWKFAAYRADFEPEEYAGMASRRTRPRAVWPGEVPRRRSGGAVLSPKAGNKL